MPKLLQINSCLDKSTGRIAQQIGEKALEAGYESFIAFPARAGNRFSVSCTFEIGSRCDSFRHALLTRFLDRHGLGSKHATRILIRQISELQPDVIHLHNIHGYYINYPILFSYLSKAGIPVVWTIHDCWPVTGHCVHFTDVNCHKWEDGTCSNCPKKKSYPSSLFVDRSKKNYRDKQKAFMSLRNMSIVTVSHWLGNVIRHSFLKDYPIRVIQNGIDVNKFYPRLDDSKRIRERYGWSDKFVILGVATGWSEDVGLSTFYKLRSSLTEDFVIAMVGLTEEQIKVLPEGITGIKRTNNQDELAEIYTASDVLFNGSFQETFGLVTAEAMACGTPVVVYDSTACPEIVDDDRGRIIPVGGFDQLVAAILSLKSLSQPEKDAMSASCVQFVKTNLDQKKKYQDYIDLYKSLMDSE